MPALSKMSYMTWMDINRLKVNDEKTELALFGLRQQLAKCISDSMNVTGTRIDNNIINKISGSISGCNTIHENTYHQQVKNDNAKPAED